MFVIRDSPPTFEEVASYVSRSVVAVAVGIRQDDSPNIVGTGFALEPADFFATCWHVAEIDDKLSKLTEGGLAKAGLKDHVIRIALRRGETYVWHKIEGYATMRGYSKEQDVCIYRFIDVAAPALHLSSNDEFDWGSEVGIVGFPMGNILQGDILRPYVLKTVIAGGLEWRLPDGSKSPRLALGTAAAAGFSGGPVFSAKDGQVVGMVASKMLEEGEQNGQIWPAGISLAITPDSIRKVLIQSINITTKLIKEGLRAHLKK